MKERESACYSNLGNTPTYQDDLEQHLLVNLHELLIPLIDVGSLLSGVGIIVGGRRGIGTMVGAPFNDLIQNCLIDLPKSVSIVACGCR